MSSLIIQMTILTTAIAVLTLMPALFYYIGV